MKIKVPASPLAVALLTGTALMAGTAWAVTDAYPHDGEITSMECVVERHVQQHVPEGAVDAKGRAMKTGTHHQVWAEVGMPADLYCGEDAILRWRDRWGIAIVDLRRQLTGAREGIWYPAPVLGTYSVDIEMRLAPCQVGPDGVIDECGAESEARRSESAVKVACDGTYNAGSKVPRERFTEEGCTAEEIAAARWRAWPEVGRAPVDR